MPQFLKKMLTICFHFLSVDVLFCNNQAKVCIPKGLHNIDFDTFITPYITYYYFLDLRCISCRQNLREVWFSCGHVVVCKECQLVEYCPSCHEKVTLKTSLTIGPNTLKIRSMAATEKCNDQ